MRKNIIKYFVLAFICSAQFYVFFCQQTEVNITNTTQVNNGEFSAEINGLKLWYKVSGTGPVCIFPTPGWGPSSELYFLKLTPLEEMFTMVYLDTRGSGHSEKPELNAYSMKNFADDVEGLREHLGVETMWLMGHSDGGLIILNYASENRNHIEGLILVDTPMGNTSTDSARMKRMQLRKNEPWFDDAFKAFQKIPTTQKEFESYINSILPFFFSSVENLEKNRDVFAKITLSFNATLGRAQSDQSSVDLSVFLPVMKIPTLVIVGIDDFICTLTASEYLHCEISNSKLLVIENAGHFPWLEQPQQFFNGIKTFLSKLGYHKN
jgi:proline iminopeptidase